MTATEITAKESVTKLTNILESPGAKERQEIAALHKELNDCFRNLTSVVENPTIEQNMLAGDIVKVLTAAEKKFTFLTIKEEVVSGTMHVGMSVNTRSIVPGNDNRRGVVFGVHGSEKSHFVKIKLENGKVEPFLKSNVTLDVNNFFKKLTARIREVYFNYEFKVDFVDSSGNEKGIATLTMKGADDAVKFSLDLNDGLADGTLSIQYIGLGFKEECVTELIYNQKLDEQFIDIIEFQLDYWL